ncbi:tRNA (guanine-N(7)-)-methyltransferase non-catalytic subunit trm82 [Thecaphora frezii]
MASVPYHFVTSAHRGDTLALLSANAIHLVSPSHPFRRTTLSTSVVVPQPVKPDQSDALKHAASPKVTFPRIAAFSRSDRYLAVTGDDKILRVFRVDASDAAAVDAASGYVGLAEGKEVLVKPLPKRAAILRWLQPNEGDEAEELVVVDKFGDLRSFLVDSSTVASHMAAAPAAEAREGQEQDEMDRPTDPSLKILLGHVSMITDIAFTPQPSASAQPKFLITSDRDEHIRISRWGPRRAAHVIERFLLGSSSFVGSLCIVRDEQTDSSSKHRLVTSDGGKMLRVWALPEAEADAGPSSETLPSSQACLSVSRVEAAIAPYVVVREREEKRREAQGYHPGGKKNRNAGKRKRPEAKDGAAAEGGAAEGETEAEKTPNVYEYNQETEATKAITRLEQFEDATGKRWLLMAVEGSTAFFHLPLSAVLAASSEERDLASEVRATVVSSAPILDFCTQPTASGGVSVWTAVDVRPEFRPRDAAATPPPALQQYTFNAETATFEVQPAFALEVGESETPIEPFVLSALALYPVLTNWPKVDAPSSAEMLAERINRKGRPANGLLDEAAATPSEGEGQAAEGSEAEAPRSQKMVKRMQEGRRARGREKNRADLGLVDAQQ